MNYIFVGVVFCVNIGKDGYADAHPDLTNPYLPGLGIVKYLGPITIENEPILLFWHESASIQVEMSCSYPEMIHHSINLWELQERGLPTDSLENALGSNYQKFKKKMWHFQRNISDFEGKNK